MSKAGVVRDGAPEKGLEIARVVGVHGLRGSLKVVPHWAGSTALEHAETVTLCLPNGERRQFKIESVGQAGKTLLVKLEGVDTREQAEALRRAVLEVPREHLESDESEAPFLVDLVGAEVEAPDGVLGRVVEVVVHPSVDSVLVEKADGTRVEVVLRSEFLAAIDKQRIVLASADAIIG